jgi:hypothetical protein
VCFATARNSAAEAVERTATAGIHGPAVDEDLSVADCLGRWLRPVTSLAADLQEDESGEKELPAKVRWTVRTVLIWAL